MALYGLQGGHAEVDKMKRTTPIIIAVLLLSACGMMDAIQDRRDEIFMPMEREYAVDVKIATALPESPDRLPIYRVANISVNSFDTDDRLLKLNKNVPSEFEAIKIAKEFTMKNGGIPNNVSIHANTVYLEKLNTKTGKILERHPSIVQVTFGRNIGGMPVVGPCEKIWVSIGENGEVASFHKRWAELEPAGDTKIISAIEAIEKLKKGDTIYVVPCPIREMEITGISLGYYVDYMDCADYIAYSGSPSKAVTYEPIWMFDLKTDCGTMPMWIAAKA